MSLLLQGGVEEVEFIKPWLYTIQARAPNSHTIIVGTHLDKATELSGLFTVSVYPAKATELPGLFVVRVYPYQ